jgi:hypothetical protein
MKTSNIRSNISIVETNSRGRSTTKEERRRIDKKTRIRISLSPHGHGNLGIVDENPPH